MLDPVASQKPCSETMNEISEVRRLVRQFGWNTTCFQLVNPGISHWFSPDREAVVGYVRKAGVTIVAGAPVCDPARLREVVAEFEAAIGPRVCYFGAEARFLGFAKGSGGYSFASLGSQPVWRATDWHDRVESDASLRAQLNRARNKGVSVVEWNATSATNDTGLARCLEEWLETRGLPPLHFLVEPQTLGDLEDRRIFVAQRDCWPVGFTVLSPIPSRDGWLTEQFVRGRGAPNGTVELMLDTAVRAVAAAGAEFVTMGIVPLSRRAPASSEGEPTWLRFVTSWVRAHGRRFYDFDGLDWFKAKFHPDYWEPVHAVSREPEFSFRTLYAIASAFTEGSPIKAVLRGFGRALRQEWTWATHRS